MPTNAISWRFAGPLILTLVLLNGCGKKESPRQPVEMVPLDSVPSVVMEAARKKYPDVKFETAWKEKEAGMEVYEIRGRRASGKTEEVEVTPAGEVLEAE